MKGTASGHKMMANMETYGGQNNPGYKPPSGSAGSAARGEHSHKSNPLSTPRKGSEIGAGYGNADYHKVNSLKGEQARKESLRGQPC